MSAGALLSAAMANASALNRTVLKVFGPLLILTGLLGFLVPPELALMSGAAPYNVFHLLAGAIGTGIAFFGSVRAAAGFNVIFGAIDLWQFLASLTGWFPKTLFLLRPADDVLHVVIGLALVIVGVSGLRPAAVAPQAR